MSVSAQRPELDWRPSAPLEALRFRAALFQSIRAYFMSSGAWEVETPIAARTASAHTAVLPVTTSIENPLSRNACMYLQTSPESHMKRLLACGSGSIFQICKAFRADGADATHNPEFTILEWYRPGMSLQQIMEDTASIAQLAVPPRTSHVYSYADLFLQYVGVNPHEASIADLRDVVCSRLNVPSPDDTLCKDDLLDLLMSKLVEPSLGREEFSFVIEFPASQACMACIREGSPPVAERFELFIDGVEIANGYSELDDPRELGARFDHDLAALIPIGPGVPPKDDLLWPPSSAARSLIALDSRSGLIGL